jgi:uncharacterized protein YabE (DUF348 family)
MNKLSSKFSKKYIVGKQKGFLILRHHPFAVPVVTFLALFIVSTVVFIGSRGQSVRPTDSHVVIISHDKQQQTVPTRAANVGELLKRLNIAVNEGDVVEPAKDAPIVEDNFRINVYRAHPVTIIDDGHKTLAYNAAATPRSIAAQAGVKVYPEDNIVAQPSRDIVNEGIGETVIISRATATNLNLYGTPVSLRSRDKTVGDLLKSKKVKLAPDDTVTPALTTPLTANIQVFVTRNGTQIATTEEAIPTTTETVEDATLSFGTTVVRQEGSDGKKVVTYQINLQNGVEIGRTQIQEVTAVEPVKRLIARGKAVAIPDDKTGLMAAAGIAATDYPYANYIISRESGWCPTKWQGQVGYCPAYYTDLHSTNAGYGYGLCQSTPANKMASAGADWQTNPVTQLRWCAGYAVDRYGSWGAAYNHWLAYNNW